MKFVDIGTGLLGIMEYLDQPIGEAAKYCAIMDMVYGRGGVSCPYK